MDTANETRVSSRLTGKSYISTINELYGDDDGITSELYQVKIFNHNLVIAPGKVIADESIPNLSYCYVYAIKDDRVICKLGVYEMMSANVPDMFDLSTFDEGSMLLFDLYSTEPARLLEL